MKAMLGRLETPDRGNLMFLEAPLCSIFFISSFIWESTASCFWASSKTSQNAHGKPVHVPKCAYTVYSIFFILLWYVWENWVLLVIWEKKLYVLVISFTSRHTHTNAANGKHKLILHFTALQSSSLVNFELQILELQIHIRLIHLNVTL